MTEYTTTGTLAAGTEAGGVASSVSAKVGGVTARAMASGLAGRTVIILGPSALFYIVAEPHYHVPADHGDWVALGTEVALLLVVVFVGGKIILTRRFARLPDQ